MKRRVQKDPASIAFAQLAEEHRRAGQFEEAVQVATAGLGHHPAYLSARVTLGRALLELGRLDKPPPSSNTSFALRPTTSRPFVSWLIFTSGAGSPPTNRAAGNPR